MTKPIKIRKDLCPWIVEALNAFNGSAKIIKVKAYILDHHGDELKDSGNLFFTWNDDIFWAATQLRAQGTLKKAKATSKSVWELAGHPDRVPPKTRSLKREPRARDGNKKFPEGEK